MTWPTHRNLSFSVSVMLLFAITSVTWSAVETICPDGASSRSDIVFCTGFEVLTNCLTDTTPSGMSTTCWDDNDLQGAQQNPFSFRIVNEAGKAAAGSGFVKANPQPGSAGAGFTGFQGVVGPYTDVSIRYYFKRSKGYMAFSPGPHGPDANLETATAICQSGTTNKLDIMSIYYGNLCPPFSNNIPANQGSLPIIRNDRWYRWEVRHKLDTVHSPRATRTGSMTIDTTDGTFNGNGYHGKITCATCAFTTDPAFGNPAFQGQVGVGGVKLSGFVNGANNAVFGFAGATADTLYMARPGAYVGTQPDFVNETATGTAVSIEPYDANGIAQVWIDNQKVMEHTNINYGATLNGTAIRGFFGPRDYNHYSPGPWGYEIAFDGWVISDCSSGACDGAGPHIGAASDENTSQLGTADTLSPYRNSLAMDGALGRRVAPDCTSNGGWGGYNADTWRQSQSDSTIAFLQNTVTHGLYTSAPACAQPKSTLASCSTLNSSAVGWPLGTVWQINNGASATDCASGGDTGSFTVFCKCTGAGTATAVSTLDAAGQVTLVASDTGGGITTGRIADVLVPIDKMANHGWIYVPSEQSTPTRLALSGMFREYNNVTSRSYVALTIQNNHWGIIQHPHASEDFNDNVTVLESAVDVNYDTWTRYELMIWPDNKLSLMIDGQRVYNRVASTYDTSWITNDLLNSGWVIGIMDFRGTPPFTAYFDDYNLAEQSFWSCDGWSATNCPTAPKAPTGLGAQ